MEQRIFSDPSIPAAFEARAKFTKKKPLTTTPQRNCTTGQVEFQVEGNDIDEALSEIYQNSPVGVLDYIKALKGLRSSIFALKAGGRNEK